MKTVALVALTGVVLGADHPYMRIPKPTITHVPVKVTPHFQNLGQRNIARRFDDEEFNYQKDFEKLEETAKKHDPKKVDGKDDFDEDELEILRSVKNLAELLKLVHHEPVHADENDNELALTRPVWKNEVKFDDEKASIADLIKAMTGGPRFDIKGNIKFDDEELNVVESHGIGKPRHQKSKDHENTKPKDRTSRVAAFSRTVTNFDDDELSSFVSTTRPILVAGSSQPMFTAAGGPWFIKDRKTMDLLAKGFDDEGDNSLFDLGGLVKDGLNIYKDVKSHNYGDLIHHGKDAVSHIKTKKH